MNKFFCTSKHNFIVIALLVQPITTTLVIQPLAWAGSDSKVESTDKESKLKTIKANIKSASISQQNMQYLADRLAEEPNDAELHAMLGQCYDLAGLREMAREQYAFAARLDPTRMLEVLARFKDKYRNGDPSQGFLDWVEIRKRFPEEQEVAQYESVIARLFITVALAEQAYIDEASHGHSLRNVDAMLSILESQKGNYKRALELANYEFEKHQTEDTLVAKAMALIGLKKYPAARVIASAAYRRNFFAEGTALVLAQSLVGLGKYDEALPPALVNVAAWPDGPYADESVELLTSIIKKLPPDALDKAMQNPKVKFVTSTAKSIEFNMRLAKALLAANQKSKYEAVLAKACADKALPVVGFLQYGQLLQSKGEYRKALEVYNEGIQSRPDSKELMDNQTAVAKKMLNRENDLALRLKEALHSK